MKKIVVLTSLLIIVLSSYSGVRIDPKLSKWFQGTPYTYIGYMHTLEAYESPLNIAMVGGERSVYRLNDNFDINIWYFGYLDKSIGYTYGGLSLSKNFAQGFYSLGTGIGFTSTSELIYAFTLMGEFNRIHWFANTEHGIWNWHRMLLGYYFADNTSMIVGSQAFLGPGVGGKVDITPSMSLETMLHWGVSNSYLGSINDQGGFSLNLSVSF